MDKNAFLLTGSYDRDPDTGEFVRVKSSVHREAGAEEPDFLETERIGALSGGPHDAQEWNGRSALDFGKDDVRSVGGDEGEVCSRARKGVDSRREIVGEISVSAGVAQRDTVVAVETVDEDLRRPPLGGALAVESQNRAVVVNGGFRPEAADDACDLH